MVLVLVFGVGVADREFSCSCHDASKISGAISTVAVAVSPWKYSLAHVLMPELPSLHSAAADGDDVVLVMLTTGVALMIVVVVHSQAALVLPPSHSHPFANVLSNHHYVSFAFSLHVLHFAVVPRTIDAAAGGRGGGLFPRSALCCRRRRRRRRPV